MSNKLIIEFTGSEEALQKLLEFLEEEAPKKGAEILAVTFRRPE